MAYPINEVKEDSKDLGNHTKLDDDANDGTHHD